MGHFIIGMLHLFAKEKPSLTINTKPKIAMKKNAKNIKKAVIYARQSKKEQNSIKQQFEDLEQFCQQNGWIVIKKFKDKESGTTENRKEYQELLDFVWKGKADVVLVWKFDRFGRSMNEMVKRLMDFEDRGVDFVSYHDNIDTTGPMGKAIFGFIAAMAEIEAENIRKRVKRGMQNAKKNGTKSGKSIGRPTVAEKEDVNLRECVRLIEERQLDEDSMLMPKHIQNRSGVTRSSYYRVEKAVLALMDDPELSAEELSSKTSAGKRLVRKVKALYNNLHMEV